MKIISNLFLCIFLIAQINIDAQNKQNRMNLSDGWFIKSSTQVTADEKLVSDENFSLENWFPAKVPSTVLSTLIKNKVYPDIRIGMNEFLVPDASDEFNKKHDLAKYSYLPGKINPFKDAYWYRNEFKLPADYKNKQVWLNFDGINYSADVWLNGKKVADKSETSAMLSRYKLNITSAVKSGAKNILAVKVYQQDKNMKLPGQLNQASAARDRNMGIYQDVFITSTGDVQIENPYVVTTLPLPDTTNADIKISADVKNTSQAKIKGVITGQIDLTSKLEFPSYTKDFGGSMPSIRFSKDIELEPGELKTIEFNSADFQKLNIKNPHLWWPNGYGKQYLHNLKLEVSVNNITSDVKNTTFGIRQITNTFNKVNEEYGRIFNVNGKRVFCKGGWLQSDILQDIDKKRAYDEARLLAEANINMVANEDSPALPEFVMEAYDKYGIMVWEIFYPQMSSNSAGESANNNTEKLALKNAEDLIKRYRNNASLVLWFASRESAISESLYTPLRNLVKALDTTRPFIPSPSVDGNADKLAAYMKPDLPIGMSGEGEPDYNWYPEYYYFNMVLDGKNQMFRNRLGTPSLPNFNSLKKFIPEFSVNKTSPVYPLDSVWLHLGNGDGNKYSFRRYDSVIRNFYGFPSSVEDYVRKAQLVNANSYRAMYEAARHKMWDITSGVMLWKLNDRRPSLSGQLFDWYSNPNAAYYFAKNALSQLHIQLNTNTFTVSVINDGSNTYKDLNDVVAYIDVYDLNLEPKWNYSLQFGVEADCYKEAASFPVNAAGTDEFFVKLTLKNRAGKLLNDNFYWFSNKKPISSFNDLAKLEPVGLQMKVNSALKGKEYHVEVKLKNNTKKLSFFNRLVLTKGKGGEEVLPTFWSDNFITLMPGEEKIIKAVAAKQDLDGAVPTVIIDQTGLPENSK